MTVVLPPGVPPFVQLPPSHRSGILIRIAPTLLCMVAIFGLSSRSTLPQPRSISGEAFSRMGHFGAYFMLAVTIWWALGFFRIPARIRLLLAWAGAVIYGLTDEWHQSFVPGRTPDIHDIFTDAIGAAVGVLIMFLLIRRFGDEEGDVR